MATKKKHIIPMQFRLRFGGKLADDDVMKRHYPQIEEHSEHNSLKMPAAGKTPNQVSRTLYKALLINEEKTDRRFFRGFDGMSVYVELDDTDTDETGAMNTTVVKATRTASGVAVQAATVSGDAASPIMKGGYKVRTDIEPGHDGTAVLLAVLPYILEDSEAKMLYSTLSTLAYDENDATWDNPDKVDILSRTLCRFTDNIYRRMNGESKLGAASNLVIEDDLIKNLHSDALNVNISSLEKGEPKFIRSVSVEERIASLDLKLGGDYTEEEKAKIPVLPEGTIIPKLAVEVATNAKLSSKYSLEPFRVAGFFGPAGCGKSVAAKVTASLLGLPHVIMTMCEDTDKFDLIGMLLPRSATGETATKNITFDEVREDLNLPSSDECDFDTEASYIRVFKRSMPEGTEPSDVISEVEKIVGNEIQKRLKRGDYKFVKSPLVQAIENGYLCEIQEIGAVRKQSVIMALNAWLETGENAFATLTTGQTIKKDPNCTIIFTSNDGYEGTRKIQRSVFDRFSEVYWLNGALPEVMAERAYKVTREQFPKKDKLVKMAEIIKEITAYSDEVGISDGIVGQRSLNNWAVKTLILSETMGREIDDDLIRTAMQSTVVNKISQNVEDIEDVVTGVVDKYFTGRFSVRQNMA